MASLLVSCPKLPEALMVTIDGLRNARVDTGVPTKADAHAAVRCGNPGNLSPTIEIPQ